MTTIIYSKQLTISIIIVVFLRKICYQLRLFTNCILNKIFLQQTVCLVIRLIVLVLVSFRTCLQHILFKYVYTYIICISASCINITHTTLILMNKKILIISLEVVRCRDFIFTTISNIVVHKSWWYFNFIQRHE